MSKGTIYWDDSSRGYNASSTGTPHKRGRWVGERNENGRRVRFRSTDYRKVLTWVNSKVTLEDCSVKHSSSPSPLPSKSSSEVLVKKERIAQQRKKVKSLQRKVKYLQNKVKAKEEDRCDVVVVKKEKVLRQHQKMKAMRKEVKSLQRKITLLEHKLTRPTSVVSEALPEGVGTLKPLIGFEGYFVDIDNAEVWSYLSRGMAKCTTWKKLKIQENGRVGVMKGSQRTIIKIGKAVFTASKGIAYDCSDLDTYCFYMKEGEVKVRTRQEQNRLNALNTERNTLTGTQWLCYAEEYLESLKAAANGDFTSLLRISQRLKPIVIHKLCYPNKRSKDRMEVAYSLTEDLMISRIKEGKFKSLNLYAWLYKSTRGEYLRLFPPKMKHLTFEALDMYYDGKDGRTPSRRK